MGIDHCKSCGKKFGYWQLVRSFWRWGEVSQKVKCRFCGQEHTVDSGSDKLAYFLLFGPLMFVPISLGAKWMPRVYVYLAVILFMYGLSFLRPYIVRYQIERDLSTQKKIDRIILIVIFIFLGIFLVGVFLNSIEQRKEIENKMKEKSVSTAIR